MNEELPVWLWEVERKGVEVKKKKGWMADSLTLISLRSSVVLEYSGVHTGYVATSTWSFLILTGQCCTLFVLRQSGKETKQQMGRAIAVSGVIPLCSLTSVYFTLFFKQFQLTSKLWPKVREPYTLSNGSIIMLTKATTGANTISHLLHVFPLNHLYLRDTNTSAGLRIDLGTDTPHSLFHFPWTTRALLVNSNCNSLHCFNYN